MTATSTRRREVWRLVALGHSIPEIAALLGISQHTVKNHVDYIRAVTGARGIVDLAHKARELGIITAEDLVAIDAIMRERRLIDGWEVSV